MPTTITFSAIPDDAFNYYAEQGFSFGTEGNFPNAFLNGQALNPVGDGDYVFVNYSNDHAIVQQLDGHTFGVLAVDLNGFAWASAGVPGTAEVTFFFRGYTSDGLIEASFRTDNRDAFETVNLVALDPRFASGLFAFQWWAGDNTAWGSFDNLIVQANRAPVAQDVTAVASAGALYAGQLVASDADGQALQFAFAGAAGPGVRIDPDGKFYVTPTDADLELPVGQSRVVSFQYYATDGDLSSATKTATVTLQGQVPAGGTYDGDQHPNVQMGGAGGDTLRGYQQNDTLVGLGGDDKLYGNQGQDWLDGGTGKDTLDGGSGKDTLVGGRGDDRLTGGNSSDEFRFDPASGNDVVTDFDKTDALVFNPAMFGADASFAGIMSHTQQVGRDVVISYMGDDDLIHTITLLDVSRGSLRADDFLFG